MRDEHRRQAQGVEQLPKLRSHACPRVRVESRKRLVEQQQRRIPCQRPGECHALALSAGELPDASAGERLDPEPLEQRLGVRTIARPEADVPEDVEMREQRVLLEEVADSAPLGRDVDPHRGVEQHRVADAHAAALRSQESRHHAQNGRLPGSRRTDEGERLALLDGQVGSRLEGAKGMSEVDAERHRIASLTVRRTSALIVMRRALIASATVRSTSNCS